MKTALVVGGTGFIGVHLANQLSSNGYAVTVMDKALNNYKKLNPNINFILDDLRNANLSGKYDYVYHLASNQEKDVLLGAEEYISTNIWGAYKIIQKFPTARVVFVSSHGVGDLKHIYSVAKRGAEHVINMHANAVILRFWNIFGEYQKEDFISTVCDALKKDGKIYIEDGKRDYTYVKDLVAEMVDVAETTIKGSLDLSYGEPISSVELYRKIVKLTKKKEKFEIYPYKKDLVNPSYKHSIKEPRYGLATGLRNTVRYYMSNNNN